MKGRIYDLIEGIRNGSASHRDFNVFEVGGLTTPLDRMSYSALRGDLNASRKLHAALTPDWHVKLEIYPDESEVLLFREEHFEKFRCFAKDPSCAWLLSILTTHMRSL